jgi:hypothetical protein
LQYAGLPLHGRLPGYLLSDFNLAVVWLAPVGLVGLFRRHRRLLVTTLLVFIMCVLWGLNYRIGDVEVYYLMAHVVVALWIGCGIRIAIHSALRLWRRFAPSYPARRIGRKLGYGVAGLLPLIVLGANAVANDKSRDRTSLILSRNLLTSLPQNALVIGTGDDYLFPLYYTQHVEKRRPDVEIVSMDDAVYPLRVRLVERRRSQTFKVNVPPAFIAEKNRGRASPEMLKRVVRDNLPYRPIYFLGLPEIAMERLHHLHGVIPGYRPAALAALPLYEVAATPTHDKAHRH